MALNRHAGCANGSFAALKSPPPPPKSFSWLSADKPKTPEFLLCEFAIPGQTSSIARAGLVLLWVFWVLAAGGRLPKARRGRGHCEIQHHDRTPPAIGPWCRRNSVSCGYGRGQNQLWLTDPTPKPTPAWLSGAMRRSRAITKKRTI